MTWLFRRHFWIIHLVFLSITAFVVAKTVTTIAGYWLEKSIPEKPVASNFMIPEEEEEDEQPGEEYKEGGVGGEIVDICPLLSVLLSLNDTLSISFCCWLSIFLSIGPKISF